MKTDLVLPQSGEIRGRCYRVAVKYENYLVFTGVIIGSRLFCCRSSVVGLAEGGAAEEMMAEKSLLTVIGATATAALILAVFIFGWRVFAEKWHQSKIVNRYHLTLWVRLAILAAIAGFVIYNFINPPF